MEEAVVQVTIREPIDIEGVLIEHELTPEPEPPTPPPPTIYIWKDLKFKFKLKRFKKTK